MKKLLLIKNLKTFIIDYIFNKQSLKEIHTKEYLSMILLNKFVNVFNYSKNNNSFKSKRIKVKIINLIIELLLEEYKFHYKNEYNKLDSKYNMNLTLEKVNQLKKSSKRKSNTKLSNINTNNINTNDNKEIIIPNNWYVKGDKSFYNQLNDYKHNIKNQVELNLDYPYITSEGIGYLNNHILKNDNKYIEITKDEFLIFYYELKEFKNNIKNKYNI